MNDPMVGAVRPSFARTAFDGRDWATNVEITGGDGSETAFAMPALVDGQCRVWGELAYPLAGKPFEPIDKYRDLMVAAGVAAYREIGNDLGSRSYLESTQAAVTTPQGSASGPTIDCAPGLQAQSRIVATSDDVFREVDRLVGEQVQWISTGSFLTKPLLECAIKAADQHGLKVAHRPGEVSALEACQLGVRSVSHLPRCIAVEGSTPLDKVLSASTLDVDAETSRLAMAMKSADTMLVPLLLAWRRSCVLEEVVNEPRLDALIEIAPFHSYLRDLRGAAAMTFGKKYAKRYLGLSPMRAKVREQFDEGWSRLLAVLRNLDQEGVHLLPGSDATGLSLVPGYALHGELALWADAGIPVNRILAAATSKAAAAIDISNAGSLESAGAVLVGDAEVDPSNVSLPELLRSLELCRVL